MNTDNSISFRRMLVAFLVSLAIINIWDYFFPTKNMKPQNNQEVSKTTQNDSHHNTFSPKKRDIVQISNKKVVIDVDKTNLLIDNVKLIDYNKNILIPINQDGYKFISFGILENNNDINDFQLTNITKSSLDFESISNRKIKISLMLDEEYGLTVQINKNNGQESYVQVLENKPLATKNSPSHEGFVVYKNNAIKEIKYSEAKKRRFSHNIDNTWLGISFKYWYFAIKSDQQTSKILVDHDNEDVFGVISNESKNNNITYNIAFGPKNLDYIKTYSQKYNMPNLDKIIDFGMFHLIAKPILSLTKFFFRYINNYGIAIILTTIFVKIILFFLSRQSYSNMSKMKAVQTQISEVRELHKGDAKTINEKTIELYRKNGINPFSGILPLLLQIPVFFAMYKVFSIAIEFRGQEFLFWQDISKNDNLFILNGFGYFDFTPPSFMQIGILPVIMGLTMYIQQKLSAGATPSMDPQQQKMMELMPLIFIFIFSSFPVGLMIYWITSNIFGIVQQIITNIINANRNTKVS